MQTKVFGWVLPLVVIALCFFCRLGLAESNESNKFQTSGATDVRSPRPLSIPADYLQALLVAYNDCVIKVRGKHQRSGHLFQGRYKTILVDKDNYLPELSRHLHLNPVRARMVSRAEEYPYSSYPSYISAKEDHLVSRDLIRSMISNDPKDTRKRYRKFVESVMDQEIENPLKGSFGGAILGGQRFVKEALGRLKEEALQDKDISRRGELRRTSRMEDVVEAICARFHLQPEALLEHPKDLRDVTIYLLKKHTAMTNRQISDLPGFPSYTAVVKAYQRFSSKLKSEASLLKTIELLTSELSNVKT